MPRTARGLDRVLQAVDEQLALNAFFHASKSELPINKDVEPWGGNEGMTPSLVNRLRPAGSPKREQHFFMVKRPECLPNLGMTDPKRALYEVEPTSPVTRHNYGWIEDVYLLAVENADEGRDYKKDPRAIRAARNYWSGKSKPGKPCLNEYLTRSFIPLKEVGWLGEVLPGLGEPHDTGSWEP